MMISVFHALDFPLNAIGDASNAFADALCDDAGFALNAGRRDNLRHD